jgi:hypothetical protein
MSMFIYLDTLSQPRWLVYKTKFGILLSNVYFGLVSRVRTGFGLGLDFLRTGPLLNQVLVQVQGC